jgi:hypothetical protein
MPLGNINTVHNRAAILSDGNIADMAITETKKDLFHEVLDPGIEGAENDLRTRGGTHELCVLNKNREHRRGGRHCSLRLALKTPSVLTQKARADLTESRWQSCLDESQYDSEGFPSFRS